jgi:hypothetical protein
MERNHFVRSDLEKPYMIGTDSTPSQILIAPRATQIVPQHKGTVAFHADIGVIIA